MVGGRVGVGFVDGVGLAGVNAGVCGGTTGASEASFGGAVGVALGVTMMFGVGIAVASWVSSLVGLISGWMVAIAEGGGTAVDWGSSAPPQALNRPAPPASNAVASMVFRSFILLRECPIKKMVPKRPAKLDGNVEEA